MLCADRQARPRKRQARSRSLLVRLRIGEVDALVFRVVRRNEHAQHAALTLVQDSRHVVDRRLRTLLRHQPDRADLLGDEHAAIGQERDAPGQIERRHLGHRERHARFRLQFARVDLCPRGDRHQG